MTLESGTYQITYIGKNLNVTGIIYESYTHNKERYEMSFSTFEPTKISYSLTLDSKKANIEFVLRNISSDTDAIIEKIFIEKIK